MKRKLPVAVTDLATRVFQGLGINTSPSRKGDDRIGWHGADKDTRRRLPNGRAPSNDQTKSGRHRWIFSEPQQGDQALTEQPETPNIHFGILRLPSLPAVDQKGQLSILSNHVLKAGLRADDRSFFPY